MIEQEGDMKVTSNRQAPSASRAAPGFRELSHAGPVSRASIRAVAGFVARTASRLGAVVRPTVVALCACASAAPLLAQEITLFAGEDFHGPRMIVPGQSRNLDRTGFDERTASIIVRDAIAEVCVEPEFHGSCLQLPPGEYPRLNETFRNRISSVRVLPADRAALTAPVVRADPVAPRLARPVPSLPPTPTATLYEDTNLQGRAYPLEPEVLRDLSASGFRDRARSLRVEEGVWMFCSERHLQGECMTFGPGEYAELPREIRRKIVSGRPLNEPNPDGGPAALLQR